MKKLIEKARDKHFLTKVELIELLECKNIEINNFLFSTADIIRKHYLGEQIHLRGLIEISNICNQNCFYCGLRNANNNIKRYYLEPDKIIKTAKNAIEAGFKTIVLQSGESSVYKLDQLVYIIKEIKKFDVALTLSLGEKSLEEYKTYKEAGADRYLLRIETTDKKLYKQMHPNMSYSNRLKCLDDLKSLNFELGTGCLVGLPNQTFESLADDILFFKEIEADMIGIGPFISSPNTPLENATNGDFLLALKVMALTRLLLPDINIPATTAMETIEKNGQLKALCSGANVVMPNITDKTICKNYSIYPNKANLNVELNKIKALLTNKFSTINRTISNDHGFHNR